jgi:RsiW-degrading membrane proteinase PrsW (M82 family)
MLPWIVAGILYLSLAYLCERYTTNYAAQSERSEPFWFVVGAVFWPSILSVFVPRITQTAPARRR